MCLPVGMSVNYECRFQQFINHESRSDAQTIMLLKLIATYSMELYYTMLHSHVLKNRLHLISYVEGMG